MHGIMPVDKEKVQCETPGGLLACLSCDDTERPAVSGENARQRPAAAALPALAENRSLTCSLARGQCAS